MKGRSPLTRPVVTLQPSGIFFTDEESRAHRRGPRRPLSAVTFVPEWNSLIVSVLLFSSSSSVCFPSGPCPLQPTRMPLLTFTPTAVRPSQAFPSAIAAAKVTFGTAGWQSDVDTRVSAVNKPRERSAPSGRFTSIHQLPA